MNTIRHLIPLATILFSAMNITLAADLPERDNDFYQKVEKLKDDARQKGKIPIIVKLETPFTPEGKLKNDKINEQRNAIKKSSESISKTVKDIDKNSKITEFDKLPYIATMANEHVIDALSKNPNVNLIYKDFTAQPTLDISNPLIHSNIAYSQGFSGQGQTIAVIDSGVRLDHEFLNGKIVSQACFSGTSGGTSLCPGGVTSSLAVGSAADCSINISGCGHGTHVAGIAVGKNNQFSGVAKDANLIAIKTATQYGNAISHSTADIGSGLNRVYDLRNQFEISSVNLSIGDGSFNSGSCDSLSPLVTDAINQLKSVGIATIISAGNNYYTNGMSWPACISSAVSVGNSVSELQANQPSYAVDDIWLDSNISAATDLLAPGTKIYSSSNSSSTAYVDSWGTSMAAPHVAGAFAILKSKNDTLSVDTILTALKDSGIGITDQRTGGIHTVPRVDIASALTLISSSNSTFEGLTPNGTTTGTRPTFTWTHLPGQSEYWVIADDSSSLQWPYVVYQTISASAANCASGTCSYTAPTDFAPGTSVWQAKAPQASGAWPETNLLNFIVN